jgi:hypothetical protein
MTGREGVVCDYDWCREGEWEEEGSEEDGHD